MRDEKRKRKPVGYAPLKAPPLIQVYPEHRARIDPTVIPDLSCALLTMRRKYERQARMTLSGLKGVDRERRKGQIRWARGVVQAYDLILREMCDTFDLRDLDAVRREYGVGQQPT